MNDYAEYIITLIGKNPSPNYYTVLNYGYEKTKVYEVYTEENGSYDSSKVICSNLTAAVHEKNPKIQMTPIPSDKSDIRKINTVCKSIFNSILKDCDYENVGSGIVNIIVDYTGATKSMAAGFYMYFKDIVQSLKYEKLNLTASYVSSERRVIYQSCFTPTKIRSYQLEDLFEKYNINREDLIKLHGYKIQNGEYSNVHIARAGNHYSAKSYEYNQVDIYKCNLRFTVNLEISKIKTLVDRYFEIDDEVEKIGGSEAFIYFNVIGYKGEKKYDGLEVAKIKFYDSVKGVYKGLEEKVNINFVEE